jgi:hypothetical protein
VRFDVTVPTPGAAGQHRGISADEVAELVDHAATHGLRLSIRPHQPEAQAHAAEIPGPDTGTGRGDKQ